MINHDFEMFVLCPNCNKEIWNYGFVKQRPWDSLSPIKDVMEHRLVCGINEHETAIIEFDCPDCDFATESCVYLKLKYAIIIHRWEVEGKP